MSLSFPSFEHTPLGNPPLKEVICQVRFEPILKITVDSPGDFQEAVRSRFPALSTEHSLHIAATVGQPQKVITTPPPVHRFEGYKQREGTFVSLAQNFFALSTTNYQGWAEFAEDLSFVAEAALSIYKIPYATRIGLRYVNMLDVHNTKSKNFYPDVLNVVRPELTAILQTEAIQEPTLITHLKVKHEASIFSFRYGVIQDEENKELLFSLDFDQYIEEKVELDSQTLVSIGDEFHDLIYNAFRWCIRNDKFVLFEPLG